MLKANVTFCAVTCAALMTGAMVGCSSSNKAPDVSASIRTALDQAGLKDVSESQDRDKGVITLAGHVPGDGDKAQAESIAKSFAAGEVVANQIAVLPPGNEGDTKKIDSDLDKGIENNLDAALVRDGFQHDVKYDVKNGVVTLTGNVDSETKRAQAARIAGSVPNVQQTVNELQVKDQKATSSH